MRRRTCKFLPQLAVHLQVLPSAGNRSVSLWDVPDKETLQTWLDEFLDVDCSNEVFEVREELYTQLAASLCMRLQGLVCT